MNALGLNGHIVVEMLEKDAIEEQTFKVLLPDDFQEVRSEFTFAKVKEPSTTTFSKGQIIVFPTSVMQEFVFKEETYYLVKENFIVCTLLEGE